MLAGAWVWTQRTPAPATAIGAAPPPATPVAPTTRPPRETDRREDEPVLVGRVTGITDGDTIRVALDSGPIDVRLNAIDTPEHAQPWGPQATAALTSRLRGAEVALQVVTHDNYDRLVANVFLGDESLNAWMVQQGHAWAYRQFLSDPRYCAWEQQARTARRGLWSLPSSKRVAPWEYRKSRRDHQPVASGTTVETEAGCLAAIDRHGRAPVVVRRDDPVTNTRDVEAQPENCRIKGNVSDRGKVYHLPGSPAYDRTRIDPNRGERWFCTEEEAREAGWRAVRG